MNAESRPLRRVGLIAAFTAASYVLSLLKLGPLSSIALDSTPGYFLAVYGGPTLGGIVGSLGHLASAFSGGFPLGYLHLAVALQMFCWCFVFGWLARRGNSVAAIIGSAIVAIALNGVVGPYMLAFLGLVPRAVADQIWPILTTASAVNVSLATVGVLVLNWRRRPPVDPI